VLRDGDIARGGEGFARLDGELVDLHDATQRNHAYKPVNGILAIYPATTGRIVVSTGRRLVAKDRTNLVRLYRNLELFAESYTECRLDGSLTIEVYRCDGSV
jgi:hypothetical protein